MNFWVRVLKGFYRLWMKFAHFIGKINTAILLTFFYFVCLGIAKWLTLVMRKDLLDTAWKDHASYWKKRKMEPIDQAALLKPY